MKYTERHNRLKALLNFTEDRIAIDDHLSVYNFSFTSENGYILPGEEEYYCTQHDFASKELFLPGSSTGIETEVLDVQDMHVTENRHFRYHLFMPGKQATTNKLVLMLHGFNEKTWYKYYSWAERIATHTGKAVLLFPIAFHMNRAPSAWSNTRAMFDTSSERKKTFPFIRHSSLSNVAISTRLHARPQRFVWSGLQTYYDVIQLLDQVKAGKHPVIEPGAGIDLFAYSIGAFLSEILMMADHKHYFSDARLVMFCGGPVFNRISPVSKFILDSEANVNLYSFLVEHLDSYLDKDERLRHYLGDLHTEGKYFRSILNYSSMADIREQRFREMAGQLHAVALNGDTVIYPYEVLNTLQGKYRDIPVPVDILDLPYEFIHETPFPVLNKNSGLVDDTFDRVFDIICKQLQ
ncbi:MAG: hypothetical protein JSU05_11630 [Bacteroidetes bacterium]|nr:hypothetical protein [Bacteroidota bacterium]